MLYTKGRHNRFVILLTALLAVVFAFGSPPNFSHARTAADLIQPIKPIEHPAIKANGTLKLVSRFEYRHKDFSPTRYTGNGHDTPDSLKNRNEDYWHRLGRSSSPGSMQKSFIRRLIETTAYPRAPPANISALPA